MFFDELLINQMEIPEKFKIEEHSLYREVPIFDYISNTGFTVMAWRDTDLCPRFRNLFSFYPVPFCLVGSKIGNRCQPATGIAAEIVLPIWMHLCEILTCCIDEVSEFVGRPCPPYYITRVLERDMLFKLVRYLYLAFLYKLNEQLAHLNYFKW